MPNLVPTPRYYPKLSEVVTVDNLPEFLQFVQEGINTIFDKIHYKNLQYSKTPRGDAAFYRLEIVSTTELVIPLPFDMAFVLNPDLSGGDSSISTFPIALEYQWEILAFLKQFSLEGFSFTPEDFYTMGLKVFRITDDQVMAHVLNYFVEPIDEFTTKFEQFESDFNAFKAIAYPNLNDLVLPAEPNIETTIQAVNQVGITDKNIGLLFFSIYILDADIEVTKNKLQQFYNIVVPEGIENYIKRIIIPKAKLSFDLTAAIKFPNTLLKPVDVYGQPFTSFTNSYFQFAQAHLYIDTQAGIGYQMEMGGNLVPNLAAIGNTGILLQLESLKLDLSRKENIPEADADGRPEDFTGVYAKIVSLTLPPKWFKSAANAGGATLRLGGYDLLIGSGGLSGTIALEAVPSQDPANGVITDFFSSKFSFVFPITGTRINATSKKEEDVKINNNVELLNYINSLTDKHLYSFKYPLKLTPVGTTSQLVMNSQEQFRSYITNIILQENGTLWYNLGSNESRSWLIGFNRFDIKFKQGQVVSSNLHAQLQLKKFKKQGETTTAFIDLVGEWIDEDNFKLAAAFLPTGYPLNLFDFLTITFQTIELGREEGDFFITADTKLSFPHGTLAHKMFNGQEIDLPAIRFYFDGRFEIVGGNAFIPVNFTIPLFGKGSSNSGNTNSNSNTTNPDEDNDKSNIEMSVTGIHLGSIQREHNGRMRKYNYIGLDGGISIDPIGIDVRGRGIKYYYTIDNDEHPDNAADSYFHIGTLELDLVIPGTASPKEALAIIKGSLTIPEPGVSEEYRGNVSLQLPQANIFGSAGMRLNPKHPSYLIDASVDFPAPIPLGPVGINGFRGLVGQRYVAEKRAIQMNDENTWYEYYMAPQRGVNQDKFIGPELTKGYDTAFSAGVGATISTMDGGGRTASLRAMVLLSLPSLFAVDAGLTILSERLGLAEDDPTIPPFYAFVVIGDHSLEFGASAKFQLNKSNGWMLDIRGELQAGFFFRNQRPWYINFGTKEKPIIATLFKDALSLRSYTYLLISASGIEAGSRVDFDFNFLIAKLHASIEVGGYISFERPQIGGYIKAEGNLKIDFWIFDVTAHILAYFRVEIPKPFLIYAEIRIRVCARVRLGPIRVKICVPLKFVLKWQKNNTIDYTPIPALTYVPVVDPDYPKVIQTDNYVKGIHMLTHETFELDFLGVNITEPNPNTITKIIPLDTYVDIKLEKALNPSLISNKIGGHTSGANGFTELIPPKKQQPGGHTLNQVKHKYSIDQITIKAWSDILNQWIDYHPFRAVLPENDNAVNFKVGYWQKNNDQYDTIRILATNPFSFLEGAEPGWFIPEQYGITPSSLFCTDNEIETICWDVLNKPLGTVYNPPTSYNAHFINGIYFNVKGYYDEILSEEVDDLMTQVYLDNKLIISDVQNPHDKAQSLEFKNFNTLQITLPESTVKVQLKLTTSAQGVTIRYFRGSVNSSVVQTNYELIEEIYKTKQELETLVQFDNSSSNDVSRYVDRIEIIPSSPNIQEIYDLEAQLESLMVEAQSSLTGSGAVQLNSEQLEQFNQLTASINSLKAQVCSTESGSPCIKDLVLCELYSQLLNLYNDCFLTYDVKYIYLYCQERACFINFITIIEQFDVQHPVYNLISNHLSTLHRTYKDQLTQLEAWCENQNPDSDYVLDFYNAFLSNAMSIINIIGALGNCNCTDGQVTSCSTSIQSICRVTLEDFEFAQTFPLQNAVQEDMQLMIEGFQATAQPIWRPNTKYYVHFKLKDEVDNGQRPSGIYNYYYGFRTVGPVGHFHRYPNAYVIPPSANVNEYPITSLLKYIDYERSYPNADGSLLQAKPLFYGNEQCKIDIFFEKAFAYHMLNTWSAYKNVGDNTVLLPEIKGAMHLAIKDPISDVIIPYPLPVNWETIDSVPETVGNGENGISWVDDNDPRMPLNVQILNNFINLVENDNTSIHCQILLGDPIRPASFTYSVTLTNLKPRKLYTALVYNAFDQNGDGEIANHIDSMTQEIVYEESQKVHEFVFQTSRYASFKEQVESYQLKEFDKQGQLIQEKQAVYTINLDLSSMQINDAFTLISGGSNQELDELQVYFYHPFDRLFEGVFGIKPIDAANTTEFVKIKDSNQDKVIAVLVRNPEPFNNPRIPLNILQDTLTVVNTNNVSIPEFKILFSKDNTQAFIMHESLEMPNEIKLCFKYKVWNGSQFIIPNINPLTGSVIDSSKETGIVYVENLNLNQN